MKQKCCRQSLLPSDNQYGPSVGSFPEDCREMPRLKLTGEVNGQDVTQTAATILLHYACALNLNTYVVCGTRVWQSFPYLNYTIHVYWLAYYYTTHMVSS